MNDQYLADTINAALANIIACAPGPAPWPLRQQTVERGSTLPRWMMPAAAAAIGVVGAGAVVLVGGRGSEAPGLGAPGSTSASSTTQTVSAEAVGGEPTCGAQLPAMISTLRSSGPLPGPAVGPAPATGQYVEHWELDGGTIEFRWPADEQVLYDIDGQFGTRPDLLPFSAQFSPGVGDEGVYFVGLVQQRVSADGVNVESIVPAGGPLDGDSFGLDPTVPYAVVLGWTPTDPVVQTSPCDVLQVRYIDPSGGFSTWGFPLAEERRVGLGDGWAPIDLNPLIVGSGEVPTVSVYECPGVDLVRGTPFGDLPPASSAAEALLIFLGTYDARAFLHSGYRELLVSDGGVYYAQYLHDEHDDSKIALAIDVEQRVDGTWVVVGWEGTCG